MTERFAHLFKTALIGSLCHICSCGGAFPNLTASLGGDTAGRRGFLQVVIINNTPHRALLSLGAYDQLDQSFEPDLRHLSTLHTCSPNTEPAAGGMCRVAIVTAVSSPLGSAEPAPTRWQTRMSVSSSGAR